jgi:hypothetical protein
MCEPMIEGNRTAAVVSVMSKANKNASTIFFICAFYMMNVNILKDVHKIKKAWLPRPL